MSNIIEINDFFDSRLDPYARLSEAQLLNKDNPSEAMFIAESPKVVERALASGYEPVSVLVEKKHIDGEAKHIITALPNIPVFTAEFDVLTQLTGFMLTRGVLCLMRRKALPDIKTVLKNAKRIAVMESVMNPTNVGAIFRSAAALGIDAVIITNDSSNPLYRRAIRVSMGNVFLIPWTFADTESYPDILKENGFSLAALALDDNSISIDDKSLKKCEKLAMILGNEGNGLRAETIAKCDYTVKIPMADGVDSLNVAAASAVAFWEIRK